MSKAKKMTEGHSAGPQAHWDSISDAEKDAEIERLRELVAAGRDDRKAIDELLEENERLRRLVRKCFPHLLVDCTDDDLLDEVQKEVGDE